MFPETKKAYFIGIGGAGMSALARVMRHEGVSVAGSDIKETRTTMELARSGIPVYLGQDQPRFRPDDVVVYSSAIPPNHVELEAARRAGLGVYHRAEVLSALFNRARTSVAVLGTHGKTTTTSMISAALAHAGRQPTCLVGGDFLGLETNALCGGSGLWVAEVDESDRSHMLYSPHYSVLTNLEADHMDHYADLEDIKASFRKFLTGVHDPGLVIYYEEDPVLRELVSESGQPCLRYGFSQDADWSASDVRMASGGSEFDLLESGFFCTRLRLSVPGRHNIANALAAISVLTSLGVDVEAIQEALLKFRGVRRRLEVKWSSDGLVVIDDYAHHPTELSASLAALRLRRKPLVAIFQPHRYSRTRFFVKEFARALEAADEVLITDIYGAGEADPGDVSAREIADEMVRNGFRTVRFLPREEILPHLMSRGELKGVVAFIGAGNIGECADEFTSRIQSPAAA